MDFKQSENFENALALIGEGFYVFPCHEGGQRVKQPCTAHGFKDATNDTAHASELWLEHANAVAAIACGPSGVLVIDLDGEEARERFTAVCAKYGRADGLPSTLTVKTPHGWHLYFAVTPEQTEGIPKLGTGWDFDACKGGAPTGIDWRGAGGYVIAPGAVLANGARYTPQNAGNGLRSAIAPLPEWLRSRLIRRDSRAVLGGSKPVSVIEPASQGVRGADAQAENTFNDAMRTIANAVKGTRQKTINDACVTIGGLIGAGRLQMSEGEAVQRVFDAVPNSYWGEEGERKVESDVRRAVADGIKKPLYAPLVVDEFADIPEEETGKTEPPAGVPVRSMPPARMPVPDFLSVADQWQTITDAVQHAPDAVSTGLVPLDIALGGDRTTGEGGGLRVGLTVLGATPACGKSALMLQVADHIAKNGRPVLYYALEMSVRELRTRSIIRESGLVAFENAEAYYEKLDLERKMRGDDASWHSDLDPQLFAKRVKAIERNKDDAFDPAVWKLERPLDGIVAEVENKYSAGAARQLYIRDARVGRDNDGATTVEGICEDVQAFRDIVGEDPVVIVDYLQLLRTRDKTQDKSEYDRMNAATIALKRLALDLPVVVISSFARASYFTVPTLESFKGSGGIEYTANCALVLGLRDYCDTEQFPKALAYNRNVKREGAGKQQRLEVSCVKAREFDMSAGELTFYGALLRFAPTPQSETLSVHGRIERMQAWLSAQAALVKTEKNTKKS